MSTNQDGTGRIEVALRSAPSISSTPSTRSSLKPTPSFPARLRTAMCVTVFVFAAGAVYAGQPPDPLDLPQDPAETNVDAIARQLVQDFAPKDEPAKDAQKDTKVVKKKQPFFGMEGHQDLPVDDRKDPKDAVRKLAAMRKAAIPALKDALRDPRPQVRFYAAQTLSLIRGKESARTLLPLLKDDKELVVTQVFAARGAGLEDLDEAIPDLLKAAEAPADQLRLAALEAMSLLSKGWDKCEPAFIKATSDPVPKVRNAAVVALGERKSRRALPRLREVLLKDEEPEIRANAAVSLYRVRSVTAVPDLVKAVGDESPKVVKNAASALRILVGSAATDAEGWKKWWESTGKSQAWEDTDPLKEALKYVPLAPDERVKDRPVPEGIGMPERK